MVLVALIGCGSGVAPTAVSTAPPAATPFASGPCAGMTPIDPQNPPPSLALTVDPVLEGEFPAQIGDQSLTDLTSGRWLETLCMLGGPDSAAAASAGLPSGYSLSDISVASAGVMVNNAQVTITGFRKAGGDGAALVALLGLISQAIRPDAPRYNGDLEHVQAGGKSVLRWLDPATDAPSYLYANGDSLFVVDAIGPPQADQIFAALP